MGKLIVAAILRVTKVTKSVIQKLYFCLSMFQHSRQLSCERPISMVSIKINRHTNTNQNKGGHCPLSITGTLRQTSRETGSGLSLYPPSFLTSSTSSFPLSPRVIRPAHHTSRGQMGGVVTAAFEWQGHTLFPLSN